MAPESCNLGKDEAEMLKPSSPSSSPSSPTSNHSSSSASSCLSLKPLDVVLSPTSEKSASIKVVSLSNLEERSQLQAQFGNRCLTCRKRISLSGFRCRCGDLFCARHRYSDTHDCSFDYKAAGRAEISKANPLVRAAKIIKI